MILGYLVIALDYFEGNPIQIAREQPTFDRDAWLSTNLARAKVTAPKWTSAVIKEYGAPD